MIDGIIKKVFDQWEVESNLVLHDDNVKQIEELSKTFDNIEARILSFPFIRYEIKDGMAYIPSLDFNKDYPVENSSKNSIEFFSEGDAQIFFNALDQQEEPSTELISAVDWYYNQTVVEGKTNYSELLEQAKQMEKKQLLNAYDNVFLDDNGNFLNGEQYYNETYGK